MARYTTIEIRKELEDTEKFIYSFGPDDESCKQYPERYQRWRFQVLKNETSVEEAFELMNPMPQEHLQLFVRCTLKVYDEIEKQGGVQNLKSIDFPNKIVFA
ncbi:MAG: hypothetical protein ACE3JR_04250 [Ectobacillus sp.]